MKKINFLIIFILAIFIFEINKLEVKAIIGGYDGSGQTINAAANGCKSLDKTKLCIIIPEDIYSLIRISLVEYNGSTKAKRQLGDAIYYSTSYTPDKIVYTKLDGTVAIDNVGSRLYVDKWFTTNNNIDSTKIKNKFFYGRDLVNSYVLTNLISRMGLTGDDATHFASVSSLTNYLRTLYSAGSSIEYRILVEPVVGWIWKHDNKNEVSIYYTAKALGKDITDNNASNNKNFPGKTCTDLYRSDAAVPCKLSNNARWHEVANMLYLDNADIWLSGESTVSNNDTAMQKLANMSSGQGYNSIKFYDNIRITQKEYCNFNNDNHFKTITSGPNGEDCCNLEGTSNGKKIKDIYREQNGGIEVDENRLFTKYPSCQRQVCNYSNKNHFKTATEGSGPNGENCCDLNFTYKTGIKLLTYYQNQTGKTITEEQFYKDHPECKPKVYCEYNKPIHFTKNYVDDINPTAIEGSGPNGENCCNFGYTYEDGKNILEKYMKQYKKNTGNEISASAMKKLVWRTHPECLGNIVATPTETEAVCDSNPNYIYNQNATELALLSSIRLDRHNYSIGINASGFIDITQSKYKYLVKIINGYGKVLCSEKVTISFPKNYVEILSRGSKLEWPTHENGIRLNKYPLTVNGTADCYMYIDKVDLEGNIYASDILGHTKYIIQNDYMNSDDLRRSLYNLHGNIRVSYSDTKYGGTYELEKYSSSSPKITILSNDEDGVTINSDNLIRFTINQKANYRISPNVYNYIIKGSGDSTSVYPIDTNYVNIKYGNLPIASNANNGKYDLKILYESVSGFNRSYFTSNKEYSCDYEVLNVNFPCECEANTSQAGKDLIMCMSGGCDGNTYTCKDAQKKFCSDSGDNSNYCPPGTRYAGMKISDACYKNELCRNLTCEEYVCPNYSNPPERNGKAIATKIEIYNYYLKHPGPNAFNNTISYFINTNCYNPKKKDLIYRVIDLKNPFPGKDGLGRTPGFNWNSVETYTKYILENRRVQNNAIYNKDNAMYHFKLDVNTLRSIKSYNKQHAYEDFTLTCQGNSMPNSRDRNCVSNTFVHNPLYGLQTDTSKCTTLFRSCEIIN